MALWVPVQGRLQNSGSFFRALAAAAGVLCFSHGNCAAETQVLSYAAAPADNPLKGFLPYAEEFSTFPHSMEWFYLPVNSVMTGPGQFDWAALEKKLDDVASRSHQAVFRFYLDYPGEPSGIPKYLLQSGLVTHAYKNYDNKRKSVSPDYENPALRRAVVNFITRLGAVYDGDPRIGFITAGLLGFWGEWHTYPHESWFASVAVQDEVLDAFAASFTKTRILLRHPFGTTPGARPMGYHDDSFAHSTLDPPEWHFLGTLRAAGELDKWKTQPIGGEVRPEIQSSIWGKNPADAALEAQDYDRCVDLTHATWLLNHEAFEPGFSGRKKARALEGARRLGYEFTVESAGLTSEGGGASLTVLLRNTGVAPFYYDWPIELATLGDDGAIQRTWTPPWTLRGILPSATSTAWSHAIPVAELPQGEFVLAMRVVNPLKNGKPLRFANSSQDQHRAGWLTLGKFRVERP